MIRFRLIFTALVVYTCFKSIQLRPSQPLAAVAVALSLFALMLGGIFIYRRKTAVFETLWFRALTWSGSLVMAAWSTFVLISIPFDLVNFGMFVVGFDPTKRVALFHSVNIWVLAVSVLFVALGFLQVRRGPRVKSVELRIDDLAPALDGFKIAQISDLHVGPTLRAGYVRGVVERVNATGPDMVMFTGDLADARVASIGHHLQPLSELRARYGRFYVTGNHEYYWNASELIAKMQELGFTALLNQNRIVAVGESAVLVAGVTDPAGEHEDPGHKPNAAQALASSGPSQFKILLAHRPDACEEAGRLGADLQLSGHTHAGQYFPFSLLIGWFHKYSRGLYRHGQLWVYVNPGTGYWGPADRLGVAPEITLLTLMRG
jgi:predicted MPP superfamily phosphohydrolase